MTPSTYPGARFGMGQIPIATPTNPATGQPLSPYAPQTGAGGGTTFQNQFGRYTVPAGDPYYAQGTQPSTNPSVFTTNQYESGINENWGGQETNMYNAAHPGAAPTTFNAGNWNNFWNQMTANGTGYTPGAANASNLFSGPGANQLGAELMGGFASYNPNPNANLIGAGYTAGTAAGIGGAGIPSNYTPSNAFSPQGAGSTLPNMFGQGSTGVNSGTNIAGGGGNIFGGPGMQTQGGRDLGRYTTGGSGENLPQYSAFNTPATQFANAAYQAMAAQPGGGNISGQLVSQTNGYGTGGQPPQGMPAGGWQTSPSQQWQQMMAAYAATNPWAGMQPLMQGGGAQGAGTQGMTPDQALASLGGNLGYLENIAQGGGNPVNASPAWQSAVAAMQQQIGTGAADLAARFAGSGNLDSSAYGTAMQQYYNQAQLQENALTAQYGFQAATDAQNRLLSAAQQLGGESTGALSQLSSQAYGAQQSTQAQQAAAALAMLQAGTGAAGQLSSQSYGAAGQLNQAAIQGVLNNLQNQQFLQNLGMSGASQLSQNWIQNLLAGAGLGQQQYTDAQSAINNMYQEFLRTQPYNNPLLQMMYSAITTYPGQAATSYAPNSLGSLLQGFGSLLGAGGLGNLATILRNLGIGGTPGAAPGSTPPNWTIGDGGGIDTGGGGGGGGVDLGTVY